MPNIDQISRNLRHQCFERQPPSGLFLQLLALADIHTSHHHTPIGLCQIWRNSPAKIYMFLNIIDGRKRYFVLIKLAAFDDSHEFINITLGGNAYEQLLHSNCFQIINFLRVKQFNHRTVEFTALDHPHAAQRFLGVVFKICPDIGDTFFL